MLGTLSSRVEAEHRSKICWRNVEDVWLENLCPILSGALHGRCGGRCDCEHHWLHRAQVRAVFGPFLDPADRYMIYDIWYISKIQHDSTSLSSASKILQISSFASLWGTLAGGLKFRYISSQGGWDMMGLTKAWCWWLHVRWNGATHPLVLALWEASGPWFPHVAAVDMPQISRMAHLLVTQTNQCESATALKSIHKQQQTWIVNDGFHSSLWGTDLLTRPGQVWLHHLDQFQRQEDQLNWLESPGWHQVSVSTGVHLFRSIWFHPCLKHCRTILAATSQLKRHRSIMFWHFLHLPHLPLDLVAAVFEIFHTFARWVPADMLELVHEQSHQWSPAFSRSQVSYCGAIVCHTTSASMVIKCLSLTKEQSCKWRCKLLQIAQRSHQHWPEPIWQCGKNGSRFQCATRILFVPWNVMLFQWKLDQRIIAKWMRSDLSSAFRCFSTLFDTGGAWGDFHDLGLSPLKANVQYELQLNRQEGELQESWTDGFQPQFPLISHRLFCHVPPLVLSIVSYCFKHIQKAVLVAFLIPHLPSEGC